MTKLLDVNVLLALAWPNHVHHEAASAWFEQLGDDRWATCLITQSAFVRLSMNPNVAQTPVDAKLVLESLAELVTHPGHQYLSEDAPLGDGAFKNLVSKITGYRQVTDATLLHVAAHHGASLATFDQSLQSATGERFAIELIVL